METARLGKTGDWESTILFLISYRRNSTIIFLQRIPISLPDTPQHVTLCKDVLLRPVGEEGVLLNLKTGLYFSLNPVGLRMLETLTSTPSIQQALTSLQEEYEVDPAELENDLRELLGDLLKQGLVELS